jgi:hypothetical protein
MRSPKPWPQRGSHQKVPARACGCSRTSSTGLGAASVPSDERNSKEQNSCSRERSSSGRKPRDERERHSCGRCTGELYTRSLVRPIAENAPLMCSSLNSTLRTILVRLHVSDTDGFPSRGILSVSAILQQFRWRSLGAPVSNNRIWLSVDSQLLPRWS